MPGFTFMCVSALSWVLAGFAVSDPELAARADFGGAKTLFVVLAVLMTLMALYRSGLLRSRD